MPSLPRDVLVFFYKRSTSAARMQGEITSGTERTGSGTRPSPFAIAKSSVLLAFRNGAARQPDLGEHGRIVTERLVHVGNDFHHLAEQRAFAVVDHFGHEVGADRLP